MSYVIYPGGSCNHQFTMLSFSLWNRPNESIPAANPPLVYTVYSMCSRRFPYPMAPFCIHYLCPHQLRTVPGFASPPYPTLPSPFPTSYRLLTSTPAFKSSKEVEEWGLGLWTTLLPHPVLNRYFVSSLEGFLPFK